MPYCFALCYMRCRPETEKMSLLCKEQTKTKRQFLECAMIELDGNCFAQPTKGIPNVWMNLIEDHYAPDGSFLNKTNTKKQRADCTARTERGTESTMTC